VFAIKQLATAPAAVTKPFSLRLVLLSRFPGENTAKAALEIHINNKNTHEDTDI
jgi:hypothetical protein